MTVTRVIATGLLRAWRTRVLSLLSVVALVLAFLPFDDHVRVYSGYTQRLLVPVVSAFIGIVFGASTLGEEREETTILYMAQSPVARLRIVVEAWLAAWLVTLLVLVPAVAGGFVLASRADHADATTLGWLVLAVTVATAAYTALATMLGLLTSRAVIIGVLYVILWEGSVASFAPSADKLSVAAYARRLVVEGGDWIIRRQVPDVGIATAIAVPVIAAAAALALGARRLQRMELP